MKPRNVQISATFHGVQSRLPTRRINDTVSCVHFATSMVDSLPAIIGRSIFYMVKLKSGLIHQHRIVQRCRALADDNDRKTLAVLKRLIHFHHAARSALEPASLPVPSPCRERPEKLRRWNQLCSMYFVNRFVTIMESSTFPAFRACQRVPANACKHLFRRAFCHLPGRAVIGCARVRICRKPTIEPEIVVVVCVANWLCRDP